MTATDTQARLNAVLDYLGEAVKDGVDVAREQAPLLVEEVLLLPWVDVGFAVAVSCAFSFVFWQVLRASNRLPPPSPSPLAGTRYDDGGALTFFALLLVAGATMGSYLYTLHKIYDAVRATVAPRVYLMEWVADKIN